MMYRWLIPFILILMVIQAQAQESENAGISSSVEVQKVPSILLPFGANAPDGRRMRAIGVFQSQLIDSIPKDYRPVGTEEFSKALGELQSASDEEPVIAVSSSYDIRLVNDVMVSDQSEVILRSRSRGQVRANLGRVSFAITPPRKRSKIEETNGDLRSRLEYLPTGEIVAVRDALDDDSSTPPQEFSVVFGWSLQGQLKGLTRSFDIRFPRTLQTRLVVSVPNAVDLSCDQGVVREVSGHSTGEGKEYSIDAGGMDFIRLHVTRNIQQEQRSPFVIRNESLRYEVDVSGIDWLHELTIQAAGDQFLPDFVVPCGYVTSVEIQNRSYPFSTSTDAEGRARIAVLAPLGGTASQTRTFDLTLIGSLAWERETNQCWLPRVLYDDNQFFVATDLMQAEVLVREPLVPIAWDLPAEWIQKRETRVQADIVSGDATVLRAQGTSVGSPSIDDSKGWSKLRLESYPEIEAAEQWLQAEVGEDETNTDRLLTAKTKIEVVYPSQIYGPVRLEVQPRWAISEISATASGRKIDVPALRADNQFTIWPDATEIIDSRFAMEITGTRRIPVKKQITEVPETWFLRPLGVRSSLIAMLSPPAGMKWRGDATLSSKRLSADVLSDEQLVFFDSLTDESLLFRPETNTTPMVSIARPSVAVDVGVVLEIHRQDKDVVETLSAIPADDSPRVGQITIVSPGDSNLPPYRWSVRSNDGTPPINLPSSDILVNDGSYTIELKDMNLRNRRLVGYRQHQLGDGLNITLPTISRSTARDGELRLGSGLRLRKMDSSIELVPVDWSDARVRLANEVNVGSNPNDVATRLRYQFIKRPQIEIIPSDENPNVPIVWQHDLEFTASSRGTDLVRGQFRFSSSKPIKIDYDPNLQLVALIQNHRSVNLSTVSERPIVLRPEKDVDTVRVVWSREQVRWGWLRRCRVPKISMNGVKVESSYQMTPSADTFAPSLLAHSVAQSTSAIVEVNSNQFILLMHRDLALSLGWLTSAIVFAFGWILARKSLLASGGCFVIFVVIAMLWWPWQSAIICWCIIPLVLGASVETARRALSIDPQFEFGNENVSDAPLREMRDDSKDFSFSTGLPIWLFALMLWAGHGNVAWSQPNSYDSPGPERSVGVLVPIDSKARRVGDKIYIPNFLHQSLFAERRIEEPLGVSFLSANYTLDLTSVREAVGDNQIASIEAEYGIRIQDRERKAILPFDDRRIIGGRIDVRHGDQNTLVPVVPFDSESVLVDLSSAISSVVEDDLLSVQLRLRVDLEDDGDAKLVRVGIPPIAASRLELISDYTVDQIAVLGGAGLVSNAIGLRRTESSIGSTNKIEVRYQENRVDSDASQGDLRRLYLVQVGQKHTTVECQLGFAERIEVGSTVEITFRNGSRPMLSSGAWQWSEQEEVPTLADRRSTYSLTKVAEDDSPISFLWRIDSVVNSATSTDDRIAMTIPDVLTGEGFSSVETMIAISETNDIQATIGEGIEAAQVGSSVFSDLWSGFRFSSNNTQIYEVPQPPNIILLRKQPAPVLVDMSHHLHIGSKQTELRLRCDIKESEFAAERRVLVVPRNYELLHLTINGKPVSSKLTPGKLGAEIVVGDFSGLPNARIEALCVRSHPKAGTTSFPVCELLPGMAGTCRYTVTRSSSVGVEVSRAPRTDKMELASIGNQETLLESGWIPVAAWSVEDDNWVRPQAFRLGRLRMSSKSDRFYASEKIQIHYSGGAWSMETKVDLGDRIMSDFMDVEIPKRWSKSISVSPSVRWVLHESLDSNYNVLRVKIDPLTLKDRKLLIRGELDTTDQGRVTVPRVRINGSGERKVSVSVPRKLTNEQVQWNGRGVSFIGSTKVSNEYEVTTEDWSIELASVAKVEADPIALTADARIFPQDQRTLVLCRWDLIPNGLHDVSVRLPASAECRGAWTSGRPVVFRQTDAKSEASRSDTSLEDASEDIEGEAGSNSITLPLSLSRLAQPVEILLSLPSTSSRQIDYLPELIDVYVPDTWVAIYNRKSMADANVHRSDAKSELADKRSSGLAKSVVLAIEKSLDALAERPADEVATWLLPWIHRYQDIARASGHNVELSKVTVDQEIAGNENAANRNKDADNPWSIFDRKIKLYADRFLTAEHKKQATNIEPRFSESKFVGYFLADVSKVSTVSPPPVIQSLSPQMKTLRVTLLNVLTLFMVIGAMSLLKPVRHYFDPLCRHPATWLCVLGACLCFLSTVYIGATIIVIGCICAFTPYHWPNIRLRY